jgi:hypothetical protein
VQALERCGWNVWWDRNILAGRIWEREIEGALKSARCVVVAWSHVSINSDWVWAEADEGKQRGVLLPVLLDPVVVPLAFTRIQAANLVGWDGGLLHPEFETLNRVTTYFANHDLIACGVDLTKPFILIGKHLINANAIVAVVGSALNLCC